jgi:hypothetical protein
MLKLNPKNLEENTPENTLGKYLIEKSIASKERLISARSIFIDVFHFGFVNKKHFELFYWLRSPAGVAFLSRSQYQPCGNQLRDYVLQINHGLKGLRSKKFEQILFNFCALQVKKEIVSLKAEYKNHILK